MQVLTSKSSYREDVVACSHVTASVTVGKWLHEARESLHGAVLKCRLQFWMSKRTIQSLA